MTKPIVFLSEDGFTVLTPEQVDELNRVASEYIEIQLEALFNSPDTKKDAN